MDINLLGETTSIDHVAIAVTSIDEFIKSFHLHSHLNNMYRETLSSEALHVAFLPEPYRLELIEPMSETSSVSKFIQKNGSGKIHHIAYKVKNITETLIKLRNASIHLIDEKERLGARGKKIAFIHPKSCGGILIELCSE